MKKISQFISDSFDLQNKYLLRNILFLALILRLVSVIFAKGFGMHDDHFLVIEAAQSWADGTDYNNWLPSSGATHPDGHSFLYSGITFLIFVFFKFIHFNDPQSKMLVIRLIHALFSLITISCGFRIADKLAGKKAARLTGILLAAYWFMPWLSVRNLVEVVCIPVLMWGSWIYLKAITEHQKPWRFLLAGIILGFSMSLRFQIVSFIIGFGLGMIYLLQWKPLLLLALGTVISFVAVQGIIDQAIWSYPFAEFREYIQYNIDNAYHYITGPWYSYILLMLGILIPPLSLFLFFGFFRGNWFLLAMLLIISPPLFIILYFYFSKIQKRSILPMFLKFINRDYRPQFALFAGTLLFIIFHSYFPNKQERFILPIVPMFVTLGISGWIRFTDVSQFWKKHRKLLTACFVFFWTLNIILLPFITTMYSKKARVESMVYLSKYPNIKIELLEDIYHGTPKLSPQFYLGQWMHEDYLGQEFPFDTLKKQLKNRIDENYPRFVLFFENRDIPTRVKKVKELLPNIVYETTIEPGFIDKLLYWLNPKNANETIVIYRNKDFFPEKIE